MKNGTNTSITSSTASLPKPRITWKGVGIATGLWGLYTLLLTVILIRTEGLRFTHALIGQSIESALLALGSVPVWWVVIRWMDGAHWGRILGVHVLLAPLYTWGTLEAYIAISGMGTEGDIVTHALRERYLWLFLSHFTMYVIQFAIYHMVRSVQRLRLREQQAAEFMTLARERELEALKAQINPHFLFNTLNSISATLKRAPDQAREMIAKLAGLMRYTLDCADRDLVPLREEMNFVRKYLALERHRFSDRLSFYVKIDAEEEALDTPIPPMVLQPLVENALKHGIAPNETGGTVTVQVTTGNDHLQVRVEDTGTGPDIEDPLTSEHGTGLANTSTRLEHTYGPEAALQTAVMEPSGFAVWFSIPLNSTPSSE